MNNRSQYKTKQREELLHYLKEVQGSHVTVNDIHEYFHKHGMNIGVTTIYRHLERMMEEGLVNKYSMDGMTGACFEYLEKEPYCNQPVCFHCKCEKCGKLIHLKCNELEHIQKHMLDNHGFYLNARKTVFYGICEACEQDERKGVNDELSIMEKETE